MIGLFVRQPVTVAVGVLLILLSGFIAFQRIPIQLTPNVEDTIISVRTLWEGASPEEVEREIVDEQEQKLQGIANLRGMTSASSRGQGQIRLDFAVGMPKEEALREVSDKLRQVPDYPVGVDEPVVEASDPQNKDYIAWLVFSSPDPALDVRELADFAEDRMKPVLERVPGVAEINVLGGMEREVQVRYDPHVLAQRGIGPERLVDAIRRTNQNASAGALLESKSDVRLRMVSQYADVREVERTVVAETEAGMVRVSDVAEVVETFKEPRTFVRSRGESVIAINAQREVGANVMEVMDGLRGAIARLNEPGGLLDSESRRLGLEGNLRLTQVFDQTVYIDHALQLVRNNIWIGGALAIGVLLLFLRSLRSAGIVALSIPISVVGAVVAMVAMGRSINVISLAGMAFAVGMVVDNAIVVLENVYRHLELGKRPMQAALDGTREVFGAILASTLTTIVVFVPILLIEEEAGQLFRDIALAVVAAVALSLLVSVSVIPTSAARILRAVDRQKPPRHRLAGLVGRAIHALNGSVAARVGIAALLTAAALFGTWRLLPPADYLPQGNRNLVFGLIIPPPGYSLEQQGELARRIEQTIAPFWEAGRDAADGAEHRRAVAALPAVPSRDRGEITPPPLSHYFLVAFDGIMFHGGVSTEPARAVDLLPLFAHATRAERTPGVLAQGFQVPLFRLGGSSGSAIKINFTGDDLGRVSEAALAVFLDMMQRFGPGTVRPDPGNFNIPTPEVQVVPDLERLSEVGLTPADLATAVRTLGDGAIIGDYRIGGQTIDLKVVARGSLGGEALHDLGDSPIATPDGRALPLSSLARLVRVNAPPQVNREGRRRAVTLEFTPPAGTALEGALRSVEALLDGARAAGVIPQQVDTSFTGSASKLSAVKAAMLGDGTVAGTVTSSLVLALVVVYLLMCVLFQSFLRPLIILFSVPLATLGGFAALYGVHVWTAADPYMPDQKLDILTMLGFVILIGVVVNNAILIVHQSANFMRGTADQPALAPREAIAEAVRTRVRPIFMSTLTSIGGMAPLVLMPGSGSELYRGLGSVVVGGLLVSTVFTLLLVPLLLSLACDLQVRLGLLPERRAPARPAGAGAPSPQVGSLLGLLLCCALFLGAGCAHTGARRFTPAEGLVESLRDEHLALLAESGLGVPLEEPQRGVEGSVAGRLDELERLGGPAAYESYPAASLVDPQDLAGRPQRVEPITLGRALADALANNLGLRLSALGPELEREGIVVAEAVFDPTLFSRLDLEDAETPNPVPVLGGIVLGTPNSASEREGFRAGLRQRLSSGATLEASSFLERWRSRTTGIDFLPDPAWRTGASLVLTQPLLRGQGSEVNRSEVELAQRRLERSREALRAQALAVVATTEAAYWDLLQAWSRLRIQTHLFEQGAEIERVLRERQSFDAQLAQYSDALATLERRRADLHGARRAVLDASDRLKDLIQSRELPSGSEVLLEPAGELVAESVEIVLRAAVERALARRPEVASALLDIEDARLREHVADNRLLPSLDLVAEMTVQALEDDVGASFSGLIEDDTYTWRAGLALDLPLANRAARAEFRRAQLASRAALLAYERVVLDVVLEIKSALRDVRTSWALIGAARSARVAQSENLRALQVEEQDRGRLTPEFLNLKFQRQELLAQAQAREVDALAGYNRALAGYYLAVGGRAHE